MDYYAVVENNTPVRLTDDPNEGLPIVASDIDPEQYAKRPLNHWEVKDGAVHVTYQEVKQPNVEQQRRSVLAAIDNLAGEIRSRHITTVAGQASTYEYKRTDAERFQADGEPDDPESYPWVAAEADAVDDTLSVAAAKILENHDLWWQGGIEIERQRMKGKNRVRAATTVRGMYEAWQDARDAMEAVSDQIASQQQQPQ